MKYFTLVAFLCSFLVQPMLYGQAPQQNLNTLIQPSETLLLDVSEQVMVSNSSSMNSDGIDYSPVFHKSGLVFSSDRSIHKGWLGNLLANKNSNLFFNGIDEQGDIYDAIPLPGKINSKRHEGSATFNASGDYMVYTRNCKKPSSDGFYELKLTSAIFENGQWVEYQDLPFNSNYRTCHPALSSDGKLLVFASNRPNGLGGMDLYASTYENGTWTTPYNLGNEINTSGDDVFPFVDAEGTLYFSSNGHPGMGGLDIFKAPADAECGWKTAIRFPEPFNSKWDDFSFITDRSLANGFFTSNRPGGLGLDDIYGWKMPPTIDVPILPEQEQLMTQFSILDENTGLSLNDMEITLIQINPAIMQTGFLEEPITIINELDKNVLAMLGKVIEPAKNPEPFTTYPISEKENYFVIAKSTCPKGEGGDQQIFQQIVSAKQLMRNNTYSLIMPAQKTNDIAANKMEVIPSDLLPKVKKSEAVVGGIALTGQKDKLEETSKFIIPDTNEYSTASAEIFTSRSIPANLLKASPAPLETVDIPLENTVIAFNPIYHDFNNYEIQKEEHALIDNIVWEMNQNQDFHLTIKSYSDSRGSVEYNLELSQKRSVTVMMTIIDAGISPLRLTARGMGEDSSLDDCGKDRPCEERDHQLNRRTEFEIRRIK